MGSGEPPQCDNHQLYADARLAPSNRHASLRGPRHRCSASLRVRLRHLDTARLAGRTRTVTALSRTQYARSGNVHIAYRIFGAGPHDLVLIPGTLSHVELYWEHPVNQYLLKRLTSFARVIVFDKRGQGLSDRVAEQTIEERIGDVRAVMDAAGSDRAAIYGWSEGGPMSLLFAATYPERTEALVLCGSFASLQAEPVSLQPEPWARSLHELETHWG